MKKSGKAVFFVVTLLIAAFVAVSFTGWYTQYGDEVTTHIKGADDIRWGIDIRGGVDVTFTPPADYDATPEEMATAEEVIKVRLVSQNITDYEVYTDTDKQRIIVRFPWKEGESDFDPAQSIKELGETSMLTFREGAERDDNKVYTGITAESVILEGKDIKDATAGYDPETNEPMVSLQLNAEGADKFYEATSRLVGGQISIWMDETMISAPNVKEAIPSGKAAISNIASIQDAEDLAGRINDGALPFKLVTENFSTISPSLGEGAKDAMVLAGIIAFALIAVFMVLYYRLPGLVAIIALAGQIGGIIASITGFFSFVPSFTLTLPGIAGIILSVGFGVDANVVSSERIKEEIRSGKTIDGSIKAGFERAFSAILDGNVTGMIVAIVLMGAFGPPKSVFATILKPAFFLFGPSTAGNIYSFGYTTLVGLIVNLIMGVFFSRILLKSISKFRIFRKPWLYGGEK